MSISNVTDSTRFTDWKDITNQIKDAAGTLASLSTTDKTDLVSAVNEIVTNIGSLGSLTTTAKTSIVNAINELVTNIGTLSTLTTTNKTSLVAALNEALGDISTNTSNISTNTTAIGTLGNLTTTEQTNLVGSINEVDADVSTNTTSIGTLGNLTTTEQSNLVGSINEVDAAKLENTNVGYVNLDDNHGRFATETGIIATTFDSGMFVVFNGSTIAANDKFIDDNTDNGGAAGSMGANALSLVTALETAGRTEKRYGYEFYLARVTEGGGTTGQITVSLTNYNPVITNSSIYLGAIGDTITWQGWMTNLDTTHDVILGNATVTGFNLYVDGTEETAPYALTNAAGWVHVRQTFVLTKEYEELFPLIYCEDAQGSQVLIALSGLFNGRVSIPNHLGLL